MREFLKAVELEADVRMVKAPRNNPFMFFDKEELKPSKYVEELEKRGLR